MAINERILKPLRSAMIYLGNSVTSFDTKDEDAFALSVWHAAAELEYALFLLSMTFQNESGVSELKLNPERKKTETGPMLSEAQTLLNEAEASVLNEKLLEAYKRVHTARHFMLKVQEDLAKRKREKFKKK